MGLFDFLRQKPTKVEVQVETPKNEPKDKAKLEEEAIRLVVMKEIGELPGFTRKEAEEIASFIAADTGIRDFHRFFQPIYDRYFKERKWTWPEYEKWSAIFSQLGKFPVRWQTYKETSLDSIDDIILLSFKLPELKKMTEHFGLAILPKAKKADLVDQLLKSVRQEDLLAHPKLVDTIAEKRANASFGRYCDFMRHVAFRCISLSEMMIGKSVGLKKRELMLCFDEDAPFTKIALKEDPEGITPLFPSDGSKWRHKVEF